MNALIRHSGHIAELCIALAHRWEPERIFVILTAYLDESGTHDGSPVTVMGGIVANAGQWKRFEARFRGVKKRHHFKIFHTKKFKKRNGDFKGWSDRQMLALMNELGQITSAAFTEGVTMALDNELYERDYKGGQTPKKLRLDSKYGLCFRQCLLFFILEGLKRIHRDQYPKLHFVLESGHKNAGDALRIFNEVKKELQGNDCDMLGDLVFADKDQCDPLMMADFLAHTAFMMDGKSDGPQYPIGLHPIPRPPMRRDETGVTHLTFKPGGLADIKSVLADRLKSKSAPGHRPLGSEELPS